MKVKAVFAALAGVCPLIAMADINVGVSLALTGPGASLGISYKNTFAVMPATLGGEKVNYIILDDGTDPTTAVKNARKLTQEDKVDLIIGAATVPTSMAIADVAAETKTPQIALAPMSGMDGKFPWSFSHPQPPALMMKAVAEHMKANGIKSVGFIGFSDSWGDLALNGFTASADNMGIKVLTAERYARSDTSVTAQILKLMTAKPDAILIGASGTPAALPHATLVEKGYKGPIYHTHAVVVKDFLRIGGKAVEGGMMPAGPVVVADQLPGNSPLKKAGTAFDKAYEAKFGPGTSNSFSAYTWDAYLLADKAVETALKKKVKPGTPEFRQAVRDALESTKELVGTHAVYNMSATNHNGVDSRGAVMIKVDNGTWKLMQ